MSKDVISVVTAKGSIADKELMNGMEKFCIGKYFKEWEKEIGVAKIHLQGLSSFVAENLYISIT